ncbi:MAG: helix-turn-helix domain-containing protein [Candidatus Rokubacteria bacterium]|nr:helix-turn-helix domain-containing protein [Candidatus Rokubacteria bacterium]MBI3105321.1 helix-turn-helix domain-containing protein [Candidatus Rokubacteria bacterium]
MRFRSGNPHKEATPVDRLLTLKVIAAQTGTSQAFWRKLAARREIPVVRLGRACRVREADLERFLAERCRGVRETPQ